jgi:hydroxymethylpyrimidine/phosphomethylpyrimidine kinase
MIKPPRVLVIAGSDSGGGAGIQADIKTITALGGFAMTAVTAITAQNTLGVFGIHPIPTDMIRRQIACVMEDIGADIIKIGMLGTAEITHAVADALKDYAEAIPVVLDPVMQAKGGAALLPLDALDAMKTRLLPCSALLTPNLPEAMALTGKSIFHVQQMQEAGELLLQYGVQAVLIKGGHLESEKIYNVLVRNEYPAHIFTSNRIHSRHTHGTGCTLASAIATFIARGFTMTESIEAAESYVHGAILHAPAYGEGHGAMHHGWNIPLISQKH